MKLNSLAIFAFIIFICACEKSVDVHRDYTTPTGVGSYPISTNALADLNTGRNLATTSPFTSFAAGYGLKTEIQFFSQSPIKEINVFSTIATGSRTKISTLAYTPAYSSIKKLDTLVIPYTVPTGLAAGTNIKLEVEILNQNALSVTRSATIRTL